MDSKRHRIPLIQGLALDNRSRQRFSGSLRARKVWYAVELLLDMQAVSWCALRREIAGALQVPANGSPPTVERESATGTESVLSQE